MRCVCVEYVVTSCQEFVILSRVYPMTRQGQDG